MIGRPHEPSCLPSATGNHPPYRDLLRIRRDGVVLPGTGRTASTTSQRRLSFASRGLFVRCFHSSAWAARCQDGPGHFRLSLDRHICCHAHFTGTGRSILVSDTPRARGLATALLPEGIMVYWAATLLEILADSK